MKISTEKISSIRLRGLAIAFAILATAGCEHRGMHPFSSRADRAKDPHTQNPTINPLSLILVKHEGDSATDEQIRHFQEQVRAGRDREHSLERLGWLFVTRARESFDAGYYKLAEACADVMDSDSPHSAEALLLRGHVLQNLHRFKEAEPVARELVGQRGLCFDYGLLGDVLMEQGELAEAVKAYQKMIDLRPDLHSYTRAAHMRWLTGDLAGAIEVMRLAVSAASPRDSESAAWTYSRLALYQFQSGAMNEAAQNCAAALEFREDYPPALLLHGRLFLAENRNAEAVEILRHAAELNPLPEYQWTLTEALRAANRLGEAEAVERLLKLHGDAADPRTFALFLATRKEDSGLALRLARAELNTRADVFTQDALAWSLAAAGQWEEAAVRTRMALAQGTQDARLFLHAGLVAAQLGQPGDAQKYFQLAEKFQQTLLPSEKERLMKHLLPEEMKAPTKPDKNNEVRKEGKELTHYAQ